MKLLLIEDEKQLADSGVSSALKGGGIVALYGCSTGEGREKEDNMVNFLRRVFPQAAPKGIWAPTVPTAISRLIFDENHRVIKVEYGDGDDNTYAGAPPLWSSR